MLKDHSFCSLSNGFSGVSWFYVMGKEIKKKKKKKKKKKEQI